MTEIKSLADQLRSRMNQSLEPAEPVKSKKAKAEKEAEVFPLLKAIRAYDNSGNKNMVHVRFDARMAQTMNRFKIATGVDISKLVAFSVQHFFQQNPELRTIIKQFIQNSEL